MSPSDPSVIILIIGVDDDTSILHTTPCSDALFSFHPAILGTRNFVECRMHMRDWKHYCGSRIRSGTFEIYYFCELPTIL